VSALGKAFGSYTRTRELPDKTIYRELVRALPEPVQITILDKSIDSWKHPALFPIYRLELGENMYISNNLDAIRAQIQSTKGYVLLSKITGVNSCIGKSSAGYIADTILVINNQKKANNIDLYDDLQLIRVRNSENLGKVIACID